MSGQSLGSISDVPGGDVTWQLPWEGLLAAEVAWHSQTPGLPPDGLILHRKRRGGPDNSILHDLRCRPGTSQAQEVLATFQACRYKHYLLPKSEAAVWRELRGLNTDRGDEGEGEGEGEGGREASLAISPSPDQLKPDTMPSVDFKPIWYRKASPYGTSTIPSGSSSSSMLKNAGGQGGQGGQRAISVWRPLGPPGYSSLGDVLVMGLETPPNPVRLYKDLGLFSVSSASLPSSNVVGGGGGGGGGDRRGGKGVTRWTR